MSFDRKTTSKKNSIQHTIESQDKTRLDYMDLAKGIGILCVIIGHMGNPTINRLIFSFHMPLFFLISGYFLPRDKSPKEVLIKRVKSLIPPYIFTCICLISFSTVENFIGILSGRKNIINLIKDFVIWIYASLYGSGTNHSEPFIIVPIGAIWFLLAMIWGTYIVQRIRKTNKPIFWVIIIALIGYSTTSAKVMY